MDAALFDPAWRVDDLQWPDDGPSRARWTFLIRHAVLAPSSHNAQPWRFRLDGDALELLADRTRARTAFRSRSPPCPPRATATCSRACASARP